MLSSTPSGPSESGSWRAGQRAVLTSLSVAAWAAHRRGQEARPRMPACRHFGTHARSSRPCRAWQPVSRGSAATSGEEALAAKRGLRGPSGQWLGKRFRRRWRRGRLLSAQLLGATTSATSSAAFPAALRSIGLTCATGVRRGPAASGRRAAPPASVMPRLAGQAAAVRRQRSGKRGGWTPRVTALEALSVSQQDPQLPAPPTPCSIHGIRDAMAHEGQTPASAVSVRSRTCRPTSRLLEGEQKQKSTSPVRLPC